MIEKLNHSNQHYKIKFNLMGKLSNKLFAFNGLVIVITLATCVALHHYDTYTVTTTKIDGVLTFKTYSLYFCENSNETNILPVYNYTYQHDGINSTNPLCSLISQTSCGGVVNTICEDNGYNCCGYIIYNMTTYDEFEEGDVSELYLNIDRPYLIYLTNPSAIKSRYTFAINVVAVIGLSFALCMFGIILGIKVIENKKQNQIEQSLMNQEYI